MDYSRPHYNYLPFAIFAVVCCCILTFASIFASTISSSSPNKENHMRGATDMKHLYGRKFQTRLPLLAEAKWTLSIHAFSQSFRSTATVQLGPIKPRVIEEQTSVPARTDFASWQSHDCTELEALIHACKEMQCPHIQGHSHGTGVGLRILHVEIEAIQ